METEKRESEPKPAASGNYLEEEFISRSFKANQTGRNTEDADALSSAADALAKGDDATAIRQFQRHLLRYPKQFLFRYQLAELHYRNGDLISAKQEFLSTIADAQDAKVVNTTLLVRCHTFLVEIANETEDHYSEHLHRGIGLNLLAERIIEIEGCLSEEAESLLCKSIKELKMARELSPNEVQGAWYLYKCYRTLGEPVQAEKMLTIVHQKVSLNHLTPKEIREIWKTQ